MNAAINAVENLDSKSSIYQKLGPEERKKLNRAIVDRSQPTYRACYDHHRLADRGIGFFAFYRYARRLRQQAALLDLAESKAEPNTDPVTLNEAITQLLAYRLIEAGDDESADSKELLRLVRAYNLSARTQKTLHENQDRKNEAGPALRKKEADKLIKTCKDHAALIRQQLKQQLIDYKNSRPDPDDDDSGFSISKLYEQTFGVPDDDAEDEPRRSCENPFSHAHSQVSFPASTNNTKAPNPPKAPPNNPAANEQARYKDDPTSQKDNRNNPAQAIDQKEPEARARKSSPNAPAPDTSRESLYPPDVAPKINAVIDSIKAGWAQRNAENVARAKPGSAHEKIARIYANPTPLEPDPRTREMT